MTEEQRQTTIESRVSKVETLLERVASEWAEERAEIRSDIRDLASLVRQSSDRPTNWGWVYTGLGVAVTIIIAVGTLAGAPISARANDNAGKIDAINPVLGSVDDMAQENARELDRIWDMILGRQGQGGLLDRLARIEMVQGGAQ